MFTTAEIIAVGSELLTPFRLDTNSLFVTARLEELGIAVEAKVIVGDERGRLTTAVREALGRADLVVVTGGLGPTADDLTREAVADALGRPLVEDPALVAGIQQRFAARGLRMPDNNRRQAMRPQGAVALDNPRGTAPGLWIDHGSQAVLLLPGPPRELQPMFEVALNERLGSARGPRLYRRILKIAGRPESRVDELAQPVYLRWAQGPRPIATTILAAPGQVELHLSRRSADPDEAGRDLDDAVAQLTAVLGDSVFSTDGRSLEEVVGTLLRDRRWRVAVAESCTGGLVASRLTDVPGSSDYVELGTVCYSNRSKSLLAGVPVELIARHGAVSEPVAAAMARGVMDRAEADTGVGVTGIAGPGGGSEAKPVGTVVVAVAARDGVEHVRTFQFPGTRELVRQQATQIALDMLRRLLLGR